jgi:glycosyltransferase involved in cell wall biosynthesis
MKVAHITLGGPAAAVDGIRTAVGALAHAQQGIGMDARVLDGPWRGKRSARTTVAAALQLVRDLEIDIVHFHSTYRPLHVLMARALTRAAVPYVVSPHSGLSVGSRQRQRLRKAAWVSAFERSFLRASGGVFCLSPVEQQDVQRLVGATRTWVIPNIVPDDVGQLSPDRSAGTWGDERPRLLTLARYDVRQKGLDVLVDIARSMHEVDFVVHGDFDANEPRRARDLIDASPVNVSFRPPVSGSDKVTVLQRAALYLQPSRWEGMSMAVIEAMAVETPCAVSGYVARTFGPDAPDLMLVLPDAPRQAAQVIRAALADRSACEARAVLARAWVRDHLSPTKVAGQALQAYTEATDGTPRRRRPSIARPIDRWRGADPVGDR